VWLMELMGLVAIQGGEIGVGPAMRICSARIRPIPTQWIRDWRA
jgi:hypothetical protein